MEARTDIEDIEPEHRPPEPPARWNLATRIAFRFCFVYLGLYIGVGQMLATLILLPGVDMPELGRLPPLRQLVSWAARHIFGVASELVVAGTGSGDKIFDWVQLFCLLVLAVFGAAIWSVLDRRRPGYVALHKWLRMFVRLALGSTMLIYGFSKVIPLQMPFPTLARLVEPFGNFSPMGVLWYSIGASPAYEIFLGCAEVLGGILVILPRTATLGALLCLANSIQVFTLNMTYDVPVKLLSFHLILLAVFLLAPDAPRLLNLFFLNRGTTPSRLSDLFRTRRANRIAAAAQAIFGVYLVWMSLAGAMKLWREYGGGAPKPPLYGIWNVEQMSVDGNVRLPLVTDQDRWRRVVFPRPKSVVFQRMDDSFASYGASTNTTAKRLALTKRDEKKWKADFAYQQPAPDQLVLDGEMDNHKIHMQLQRVDEKKFLLVSRGFHWVQETPFNR